MTINGHNQAYAQDEKYKLGYRAMATIKNQRAVDRGLCWEPYFARAILVSLSL